MNFISKKYIMVFACVLLSVFSTGCVAPVVVGGIMGGGAAAYFRGDLKTDEPEPFDKVWIAVVEAVEQNQIEVIKKESGPSKALIEGRIPETGKLVYITVKYESLSITSLSIRVGALGNETESRRVLNLIHQKLY